MALMLNIGYSSVPETNKHNENKQHANKNNKKRKQSHWQEEDENDNFVVDHPTNHKKFKNDAQPGPRASSLFGQNPENPTIELKKVKPIKEEVFSNELFKDFSDIHPFTVKNLSDNFGVTKLTVVQKLALPPLLAGTDALVRSQTGSGKTLAYAVPIVESLHKIRPKLCRADGIRAVVILPTRELALQTYECFVKLTRSFTWIVAGLVVGGEKRKAEKARLRKGVNVLVCTPGRLADHVDKTQAVSLGGVRWLVLDEADRLLDLGYQKVITGLVQRLDEQCDGERRQTVLLSATLTAQVEQLAGLALHRPARVDAAHTTGEQDDSEALSIPQSLQQRYVVTPAKLRLVTLAGFIHWKCQESSSKMLVFMATQDMVDYHTELLSTVLTGSAKYLRLHGSMTQHERTQVFRTFKAAPAGVLLCTDVAARGLDLPRVDWIVQYTAPTTTADYVHRVGRTARVGHTGSAMMFLVPSEAGFISQLQQKRIKLKEEEMLRFLQALQSLEWEDDNGAVASGIEAAATVLQNRFETAVMEQKALHTLACKGYVSWLRFYASYPKDMREVFNFKDLHLGHFAKSFALRDPPTSIGGIGKPNFKQDNNQNRRPGGGAQRQYQPKEAPVLRPLVSEFASGLETMKKKKTKKKK